jgi:hypothetical protein
LELTFINSRGILIDKQIIKSCRWWSQYNIRNKIF